MSKGSEEESRLLWVCGKAVYLEVNAFMGHSVRCGCRGLLELDKGELTCKGQLWVVWGPDPDSMLLKLLCFLEKLRTSSEACPKNPLKEHPLTKVQGENLLQPRLD